MSFQSKPLNWNQQPPALDLTASKSRKATLLRRRPRRNPIVWCYAIIELGFTSQKMIQPKLSHPIDTPCDIGSGTVWTATAHILTAVLGAGVLSLAWTVAQLGWIGGPAALLIFSSLTLYTSLLLTDCYRSPDPVYGKRNYTYREAVGAILGKTMYLVCGFVQYASFVMISISWIVTATKSMGAIYKSNCFHRRGHEAPCKTSDYKFATIFGILQIILSQIPNFHKLSWLSTVAAIMPFIYSLVGVALSLAKIVSGKTGKTSIKGVGDAMDLSEAQKVWTIFRALGDIAFAYIFSLILIEVQDTIRYPEENKVIKKATWIAISLTTLFYMLCGCIAYAAFGNQAPGNMLTGFGFYEPFWLIDIANICIVVHLAGAFQVFSQLLYIGLETWIDRKWPKSKLITKEYTLRVSNKCFSFSSDFSFNIFRLIWRTAFVVFVTVLAMALPFFNDLLAFIRAIGYWPMIIYFPVEMYISQKKIKRFTFQWTWLQLINVAGFLFSVAAICGSVQGLIESLRVVKLFKP